MRLTLEQRTAALLALVEEFRARRCADLIEPASEQARILLRSARAEGRRRVHTAISEARQRLAAEVGAAQARLATERRLTEQQHAVQVLQQAWSALRDELRTRWRDPAARQRWLDAHLARALETLPRQRRSATAQTPDLPSALAHAGARPRPGTGPAAGHAPLSAGAPSADNRQGEGDNEIWQVEFAADWPDQEREALVARIAAAGVTGASWQARQDIDGGLRIRAGNNVVDATIDGLLADRATLEGRLLDLLQADVPAGAADLVAPVRPALAAGGAE